MAGMITNDGAVDPVSEATVEDGVDPKDPFRGDSQRFTWTRALELGQLQAEVAEALGSGIQLAVLHQYDDDDRVLPVDPQNPVTIYVTPSSADIAALRQVLAAHKPDPYYGMDDEQKAQAQLKEKIAAGEALSPEEMTMALQMLMS